jgi:hypothetical protein
MPASVNWLFNPEVPQMESPATRERVPKQTAADVNRQIRKELEARLWFYAYNPEQIEARLQELQQEWDVERTLESNAASLALTGTVLGLLVSRKFLLLPAVVSAFLLQHAIQGWCPPLPFFRRLGTRTMAEIEAERYALKVLRGDFQDLAHQGNGSEQTAERTRNLLQALDA